ncbi:hypothetical protein N7540_008292 [Penicillium herquei]|nr:hypothetical protein N7540_008292 [Penicillium herquei]
MLALKPAPMTPTLLALRIFTSVAAMISVKRTTVAMSGFLAQIWKALLSVRDAQESTSIHESALSSATHPDNLVSSDSMSSNSIEQAAYEMPLMKNPSRREFARKPKLR